MSTYVYITRRTSPLDDDGPSISAREWLDYVARQTDFRVPQGSEREWVGEHAMVWTGYEYPIVFDLSAGQIEAKNAYGSIVVRMKAIAAELAATVYDENGVVYDEAGEDAGFLPGFP